MKKKEEKLGGYYKRTKSLREDAVQLDDHNCLKMAALSSAHGHELNELAGSKVDYLELKEMRAVLENYILGRET